MKVRLIAAVAMLLLLLPGSTAFAQILITGTQSNSAGQAASWLAGAQAGHNWQTGSLVYGIETDVSGMALKTSFNTAFAAFPALMVNTNNSIDWYSTLRGRLGWAVGQWLFYSTAGAAYGGGVLNSTMTSPLTTNIVHQNDGLIGWVGGGGIEYKWSPTVTLSLNYQYVNLGGVSFSSSVPGSIQFGTAHAQFQAVTFGISFVGFVPDGPHGIWEGNYVGAHAGGVWGDSMSATYRANNLGLQIF
jgi:outer membrane immunogenic protein